MSLKILVCGHVPLNRRQLKLERQTHLKGPLKMLHLLKFPLKGS